MRGKAPEGDQSTKHQPSERYTLLAFYVLSGLCYTKHHAQHKIAQSVDSQCKCTFFNSKAQTKRTTQQKIFFIFLPKHLHSPNIWYTFATSKGKTTSLDNIKNLRRGGRVVDCTGLENRRTERYRGFESLSLRRKGSWKASFFYIRGDENTRAGVRNRRSRLPRTPQQGWSSRAKPIPTQIKNCQ